MADRYDVALFIANGPQTTDVRNYPAASMINALLDTIRVNLVKPGEYDAIVGLRGEETRGRIKVRADGSLTIGARWNLQTPVEPCDEDGNAYVCIPASDAPPPADVLADPQPGDRVEWEDVTGRDTQILHDVTPPDGGGRTYGDRMGLDIWADPMDEGNSSPFVCVPHP